MGDAATSQGAGEQAGTACKIVLSLSSCDARGLVPGLSPQQGAHFAAKRVVSRSRAGSCPPKGALYAAAFVTSCLGAWKLALPTRTLPLGFVLPKLKIRFF